MQASIPSWLHFHLTKQKFPFPPRQAGVEREFYIARQRRMRVAQRMDVRFGWM